MEKTDIEKKIAEIETEMSSADFWSDKNRAQSKIKEHQELKDQLSGVGKYDRGDAVMTIFSGAGGDDAEDFSRMLVGMYEKYFENNNWTYRVLHQNQNDHGGYRNITIEINGKNSYGNLKNESGVHRLVRVSPFNAKGQRHTSFSLVEVIPKFSKVSGKETDLVIPEDDIDVTFTRSSGPGGQNVNKRETAVRIVHRPSGLSVHIDSERSQGQNKEKAMSILSAKLYLIMEAERNKKIKGFYISKTTDIEWGNQIRSYVLHPYKMVKDHRTNVEINDVDRVLEDGKIDEFIEAERDL